MANPYYSLQAFWCIFSPYQIKYYSPNCSFSGQVRAISTTTGVWKGLSYLCKLRPQIFFCTTDSLRLSWKDFIRLILEISNIWYKAAILFANRCTFRLNSLSAGLLIKARNRIVEKQTLNIFKSIVAEHHQSAVPDNYSTWSHSPKLRKVLIHCYIRHLTTYFQDALAYLKKAWYCTSYRRPLQFIMKVGRRD